MNMFAKKEATNFGYISFRNTLKAQERDLFSPQVYSKKGNS